jgi:hypothetical protein
MYPRRHDLFLSTDCLPQLSEQIKALGISSSQVITQKWSKWITISTNPIRFSQSRNNFIENSFREGGKQEGIGVWNFFFVFPEQNLTPLVVQTTSISKL